MSLEVKNKVSAVQLLEMINKTSYAVSPDDTRINLNGLCIELAKETQGAAKGKSKERSMRFVATDGHRLAMVTRPIAGLSFDGNALVSRKAVGEIRKMLEMIGDREVGIDIAERFLILEGQGNKIAIVLMDAEFPDYNQVLPKQKGKIAVMKSGELAQALRRVALMVTDKGKCVKFDFSKDLLRISSSSPDLGEASEELEINYKGDQLSAGFNAKYIIDITSSLTEDQPLVMELNGELGAGKFYPESDESYTAIVMPMRLT
jgi:DNA polymerase-3 subunit beta